MGGKEEIKSADKRALRFFAKETYIVESNAEVRRL